MKATSAHLAAALAAASLVAACSKNGPASAPGAPEADGASAAQAPAGDAAKYDAVGTVNAVDASNGTVNISHEAIASIGWPAMTMNFRLADPSAAARVKPGERVEFNLKMDQGSAIVTDIRPLDAQ